MGDDILKEKSLKLDRYRIGIEFLKTIALLIGSLAVFFMITLPQSSFNKNKTFEELKREKVKLILEALHIDDVFDRSEAILIIMDYYPDKDGLSKKNIADLSEKIAILREKNRNWEDKLQTEKDEDLRRIYRNNIEAIKIQIKEIISKVNFGRISK